MHTIPYRKWRLGRGNVKKTMKRQQSHPQVKGRGHRKPSLVKHLGLLVAAGLSRRPQQTTSWRANPT